MNKIKLIIHERFNETIPALEDVFLSTFQSDKITAGRGNQSAVYRSGLTKLRNGTASKMSSRVVGKGVTSSIVGGGALDVYYGIKQYAYNGVKKAFNTVRSWWNKWIK